MKNSCSWLSMKNLGWHQRSSLKNIFRGARSGCEMHLKRISEGHQAISERLRLLNGMPDQFRIRETLPDALTDQIAKPISVRHRQSVVESERSFINVSEQME